MIQTMNLRCEYAEKPLSVDTDTPRLSWQLSAPGRGHRQSAYQVLAASTLEGLRAGEADLWDSGQVESSEQIVEYAGRELTGGERCWWTVRVWDQAGGEGAYAAEDWFEMGLRVDDWPAEWIGMPAAWPGRSHLFRRKFKLEKPVRRARVYMAGLGWSELWVNGRRANDRVLDPPQSDVSRRIWYSTDAVEDLLQPGENVIGVNAGNGWLGTVRLLLQMDIEYTDGSRERIHTDSNWNEMWTVCAGPVVENSVYGGEVYDARLEVAGWCLPSAGMLSGDWLLSQAVEGPRGALMPAMLEPIRVADTLRAKLIQQPKPGVFIFDLGQNIAGWARLRVRGAAGTQVILRFAESLYPDGTVNQENLRTARARDVYILKGSGEEEWEPAFTYHGFRYIQVEGWPGEPGPDAVVGRLVRSDVPLRGEFECSNDLLNRIHHMVRWTEMSNLHSVPTDCPQRDERMGWLNDMAARSEELVYNFGAGRLLAKWMHDIEDTQDAAGAISDTAPYHWGRRPADPVSVCYLLIPWLLYTHHGDQRTLREHYSGMKKWIDFLNRQTEEDILSYSYYGDWSPPVGLGIAGSEGDSAVSRDTPGALVSTACLAYCARLLAQIAQVVGKPGDARRYLRVYERVSLAFNQRFWDEEAGGYGANNQSANSIALYMGLVPPERVDQTAGSLVRAVEKHGGHLSTGNICTKYLMEALTAAGRSDVAVEIALQEDYPSWGNMLANGATTLWERWEKATGGGMNSHNHPMMGSVGAWFYRAALGLRVHPAEPGFARFSVRPEVLPGVDWVKGSLDTLRGKIETSWERSGHDLALRVVVPAGCSARVGVPAEGWSPVYEGDLLVWQDEQPVDLPEGIEGIKREGERVVVTVGSGEYNFRAAI